MSIHSIPWAKVGITIQVGLTLLIGVIAVLIQRQQAETNRRQYRLALFEKRMKVYNETVEYVRDVVRDPDKLGVSRLLTFAYDTHQHEFLFGQDIKDFLDELFKKGNELRARIAVRTTQPSYDRETELLNWFSEQVKMATQKFLPYLDFRKP